MKKLAIMVGHNPVKRGASREGLTEFEYNLDVQGIMLASAHQFGIEAKGFWRKNGKFEIPRAYEKVKEWGPDVALELHFNSFEDARTNGCEFFWADNFFAKNLAECLADSVTEKFNIFPRGAQRLVPGDRGYKNITQLGVAAVLCEPFFVTNQDDWEEFVEDPRGVVKLASAYLQGVSDYFKELQEVNDTLMPRRYAKWGEG